MEVIIIGKMVPIIIITDIRRISTQTIVVLMGLLIKPAKSQERHRILQENLPCYHKMKNQKKCQTDFLKFSV
nr:MAG TPA: hypothetical protein [Caudoviricetes sp.]